MKLTTNLVPLIFVLYTCFYLQTVTSKNLLRLPINRLERLRRSCCVASKYDTISEGAKEPASDFEVNEVEMVAKPKPVDVDNFKEAKPSIIGVPRDTYGFRGSSYIQSRRRNKEKEVETTNHTDSRHLTNMPFRFMRNPFVKAKRSIHEERVGIVSNKVVIGFLMSVPRKISRV